MFFRKRDIRNQNPRFEFVCVDGFAGIVLGEALPQIVREPGVKSGRDAFRFAGGIRDTSAFAPCKLRRTGYSPPSLAGLELWIVARVL